MDSRRRAGRIAAPGFAARAVALALGGWLLVAALPAAAQTAPDFGSASQADLSYARNVAINFPHILPVAANADSYSLNPASPFGLSFNAGTREVVGTPTTLGTETVTYTATNTTGSDTLTFSITVVGADFPDQPDLTFDVGETVSFTLPLATGTRDAAPFYIFLAAPTGTVLPPGLALSGNNPNVGGGILEGMPTTVGTYPLTYEVSEFILLGGEDFSPKAFLYFTIVVEAGPDVPPGQPDFGSESQANLRYGRNDAITAVTLPAATGATSYSLNPASPFGLDFDAGTRALSGTPTTTGAEAVIYTATNATGSDTLTFSITVLGPDFTAQPDLTYAQNAPVNTTLPIANGVTSSFPAYRILDSSGTALTGDATGVPGLTFTAATTPGTVGATLSGAPITVDSYPITYEVADLFQEGGTGPFFNTKAFLYFNIVVVTATPPVVSYTAPATLEVGTAITPLSPSTTDTDIASYEVTSGTLPPGLTLAAGTGVISGTPTTGSTSTAEVTFSITDTQGAVGTAELTFPAVAAGPPPVLPSTLRDLTFPKGDTVATPVTLPLPSAGSAPLTFTLADADGNLPDGVRFQHASAGARALDGTPTTSGETLLTYTVRDSDGREAIATFTLTIAGPTFLPFSVRPFTVGQAIDLTLPEVHSGNIGTVSYALPLPDTLVPGLIFTAGTRTLVGELTMPVTETLTYTATDAHDNDTGDLIFTLIVRDAESPDAVNQMVLPEVARAIAGHSIGAIAGRVEQAVSGSVGSGAGGTTASANFGGQSGIAGILATHGESLLNGGDGDDGGGGAGALKTLLGNSGFVLPLNPSAPTLGGGGATTQPSAVAAFKATDSASGAADPIALWGSADYRRIEGDADFDWDGDLFSLHLGMDTRLRNNALAGFAISWSQSEIEYGNDSNARGEHELQLTTLSPYLGWQFSGGVNAWAAIGYGEGDLEITEADGNKLSSDVNARSIAVGASKPLAEGVGGTRLRLKGEALHSELEVLGGGEELSAMDVSAQRLRLAVEATRSHTRDDGARLTPKVEVGLRVDGGDGETGDALELGASLRHHNPDSGLAMEGGAHMLVGNDNYKEWGVHGILRLTPGKDRQGIAFTLTPGYGAQPAQTDRIWQQDLNLNADDADHDRDYAPRLDAELGYTLSTPTIRGLLNPYSEMTMGGDNRSYRLGLRWAVDKLLDLNLTSERNQTADDPAENTILLRGEVRF